MSEQISRELFDEFITSDWPMSFSALAQKASRKNVEPDQIRSYKALEFHVYMASGLERTMLEEMGIVENFPTDRARVTPGMLKDGVLEAPQNLQPKFSEFGREVIMACENLFTPEEHEAADVGKEAELAEIIKAGDAEFDVKR